MSDYRLPQGQICKHLSYTETCFGCIIQQFKIAILSLESSLSEDMLPILAAILGDVQTLKEASSSELGVRLEALEGMLPVLLAAIDNVRSAQEALPLLDNRLRALEAVVIEDEANDVE